MNFGTNVKSEPSYEPNEPDAVENDIDVDEKVTEIHFYPSFSPDVRRIPIKHKGKAPKEGNGNVCSDCGKCCKSKKALYNHKRT